MVDWNTLTIGALAKKMKVDGYDLSTMTTTEKIEAVMTYVTTAQVDITTAEADAAAEATLQAKKEVYLTKAEDFWKRARARFMTLSEDNATWTLAQFPVLVGQACDEIKNEMIAEMA